LGAGVVLTGLLEILQRPLVKLQDVLVQVAKNALHVRVLRKELLILLDEGQFLAQTLIHAEQLGKRLGEGTGDLPLESENNLNKKAVFVYTPATVA
jgi:hypothetical protein